MKKIYTRVARNGETRKIAIDTERDANITTFGKATLTDRYLQANETYQEMFARVATTFSESDDHAQRLYDYMSQLWFMPATPILSNGGTTRGLPISCFLNTAEDTMESIINVWTESGWLASKGGGIGCVDSETEFLTPLGWKRISEYEEGDEVMTVPMDGSPAYFSLPQRFANFEAGKMYRFVSKGGDMVVSSDHRNWVYFGGRKKPRVMTTEELLERNFKEARFTPATPVDTGSGLKFTDLELRFMVALAADGSEFRTAVRFGLKRYRKIERLKYLLSELGIEYTVHEDRAESTQFYIPDAGLRKLPLTFENFGEATAHQLYVIADEMAFWDGTFDLRSSNRRFSSHKKEEADFVQYALMASTGRRAGIGQKSSGEWTVRETSKGCLMFGEVEEFVPEDGRQYCFQTETSLWLARRNGLIFVTGNTSWTKVRSIGEPVNEVGKSSGIIPFVKVQDANTLAISQGCVDGKTEILTERGWVRFDELNETHGKVAQVNDQGGISFVTPEEYHVYDYSGPMHQYENHGTLDHFVTPNHRMAFETVVKRDGKRQWSGKITTRVSSEHKVHRDNRFYTTGLTTVKGEDFLSPLERFMIAYQADGSTKPSGTSTGEKGTLMYAFRFKRKRKIEHFKEILGQVGYKYSVSYDKNGVCSFLVRVPVEEAPSKNFSDWVDLTKISENWCREFIDEMKLWDGSTNGINTIRFDTVEKSNADMVCAIACLGGLKTFQAIQKRPAPRQDLHKVHICTGRKTVGGENVTKREIEFDGKVYCVSVPTGMFLCRRNGKTIVTGNSLRRGSSAAYLDVTHPEIEEFLEIRKPTGDANRKALNVHHGITIPDAFMEAVEAGEQWNLVSPKTGEVVKTVSARALWEKILTMRITTGEPYLLFIDTVNKSRPQHLKDLGLEVQQSNLCSEITLPTGTDHLGNHRTAVCCLSSLNLEMEPEWRGNKQFLKDVFIFLDEVLQDFIDRTETFPGFERARYSAARERSVGLGVMGWHAYCQREGFPLESVSAKIINKAIFRALQMLGDEINEELAVERGACPDAEEAGTQKRFSHMFAIAPTASISIICGGTSAGIEPIPANIYTHKTLSGSFSVKNPRLEKLLESYGKNTREVWDSILFYEGSVQHLDFLTDDERMVYKTAFEIDQRWLIDLAADRAPCVDQAVSNNLFLPGDVNVRDLHHLHFQAWKRGVKSLYYCRSRAIQRSEKVSHYAGEMPQPRDPVNVKLDYEECLACQ